jgi:hypothetical protein
MEYRIIWIGDPSTSTGGDLMKFSNEVNIAIKKGWIPQGGVCNCPTKGLFQAMIKPSAEGK